MLVTALAQERKKIFQQGEDAGVIKGQRQTLLQLLQYRFQLNEAAMAQMAEQLAQITAVDTLTALTNHALQATTVEEFQLHLHSHLPTARSA